MKINHEKIMKWIDDIYACGIHPDGTHTRLAFSKEDAKGRELFMDILKDMGLSPRVDEAGNIIARLEGKNSRLPAILTGSHLDTVPDGGKYDGVLGCVAALGVIDAFLETGHVPEHPIEAVVFADEEGARFGSGLSGSTAFCGALTGISGDDLDVFGKRRGDVLEEFGLSLSSIGNAARSKESVHCFIELHVEQGASLHRNKIPLGVVSSIAGVKRFEVTINGASNHSGSTLMADRKDALLAASNFISTIPDTAASLGDQYTVATVGVIKAFPGSVNVIPGACTFSLEIRDRRLDTITAVERAFRKTLAEVCEKFASGSFTMTETLSHDPAPMTDWVMDIIKGSCERLGFEYSEMPSGAFHDSLLLAERFPTGMIFIPSVGGISHSPLEFSEAEDIKRGCDVLLDAILEADKLL